MEGGVGLGGGLVGYIPK